MGIRSKIVLTFMLCFGMLAGINLYLLQRSMGASYDAIERRELIAHMGRVVHGVESGLKSLNSQTRDWSQWSDMYTFALNPKAGVVWASTNIVGVQALEPADLSLVMIYDKNGELLNLATRDAGGGELALPTLLSSAYIELFKAPLWGSRCGLIKTDAGIMMVCWARITHSDGTGDFVGNVLMGRLLSPPHVLKLQEQTGLLFNLSAGQSQPSGLTPWPDSLPGGSLGGTAFATSFDSDTYHLYYRVQDVLMQDIGMVTLDLPREVHAQGLLLYEQVRRQLIFTALAVAVLLGCALHLIMLKRLRRITRQLVDVAQTATWSQRVDVGGSDELGILANKVNSLLDLIASHFNSLTALSLTDTLTGLFNRRAYDERLAIEYARETRHDRPLALMLIDADHFKLYNDHYGHPAGDAALQSLAEVLRLAGGRGSDLVARIGGEEFALLLPETDAEGALGIAEHIQRMLRERHLAHAASPVAPYFTVSIGIALARAREETPRELASRADRALYQAKQSGRNRACCDAPNPPTQNGSSPIIAP